ncbi:MAG TPA: O-antigen ligase family protein [Ktedonobacterales bacterium]|nr:O-antigen ligase family protein [Ktedonobacterales bacterium]
MAFAKKLFFTVLVVAIIENSASAPNDPWSGIAWYLSADIKSWLPQSGIAANPFEIMLLLVLLIWALRGRKDRRFHFERGLLFWPVVTFGALLLFSLLWGTFQPGSNFTVGLWEVRALGIGILAYFLVGILFTHRRDLDTLTWAILIAALFLAIEDLIRYEFFLPGHVVGDLNYDHGDATILAFTILLSLGMLLLGSTHRQRVFVLFSLPVDIIAMMVTHRRAGEAALAIGMVFLALILLRVNRKLFLQIVPVTALILSLYVAAEWNCNSGSALCQPARAISSQFNPDPRDAASDQYRLTERYDLVLNIQANAFTGLGFGRQYIFYIPLPDESFWPFWHYTPHDEILWVWAKMGIVGFMAFWWLVASALYRSGRLTQALSAAGDNKARALLAAAACLIIMQMSVSYVDLGLTDDRPMLVLWIMLGVIGHLPGILRRSTNTDVPDRSTRPVNGRTTNELDKETPEVQVGVLAHALIAPAEPASSSQRDPWSQRRNAGKQAGPRWGQSNGTTGAKQTSRPLSGVAQSHTSRPSASSRSATQAPAASPLDFDELELPWATRSEEYKGRTGEL